MFPQLSWEASWVTQVSLRSPWLISCHFHPGVQARDEQSPLGFELNVVFLQVAYTYTQTHTNTYTHITHTHIYIHTNTYTHITHTHIYIHINTYTHITHKHTPIYNRVRGPAPHPREGCVRSHQRAPRCHSQRAALRSGIRTSGPALSADGCSQPTQQATQAPEDRPCIASTATSCITSGAPHKGIWPRSCLSWHLCPLSMWQAAVQHIGLSLPLGAIFL